MYKIVQVHVVIKQVRVNSRVHGNLTSTLRLQETRETTSLEVATQEMAAKTISWGRSLRHLTIEKDGEVLFQHDW